MKLKILLILSIILLFNENVEGQNENNLYALEKKLMLGDKAALFEIASYFDSKKEITEFLGYHIIKTTEGLVAKRIVYENCFFLESEISIYDKATSTKKFLYFLNQNKNKIFFSDYASAFLLTPLEERKVKVEIKQISNSKRQELNQRENALLQLDWVKRNKIDLLIKEENPKALLIIASELYKIRYRFNKSVHNQIEFIDLIRFLTGTDLGVENQKNQITWFVEEEFYQDASLNLLTYFVNNYKNYKWNKEKGLFENKRKIVTELSKEELLFELLSNENDSIAKEAFKKLTTSNVTSVIKISKQYESANIKASYALPTFSYRFLNQLVVLTDYCRKNKIDFEGSEEFIAKIKLLESKLSFYERRKLENDLIESMTLNQITAFEYYALLNERSWELTYSAGRILDVFYSRNWNILMNSDVDLKLYLKKSALFYKLGIIGVCNKYVQKFQNFPELISKLNKIETVDLDIKQQRGYAKKICKKPLSRPNNIHKKDFEGNKDYFVPDLKASFQDIKKDTLEKYENEIIDLLGKINYNQIGEALALVKDVEFVSTWKDKYSFLSDDFGFFWLKNHKDESSRSEFIERYNKYSEFDLYSYYLKEAGITYLNEDNSFNYDKIYELLKFDAVTAFVGGGGGIRDNEVYSLIKLLEIKYKTTLGYSAKFCNSRGIYACSSRNRASEWMQFFRDKKLLLLEHNEPVSFN